MNAAKRPLDGRWFHWPPPSRARERYHEEVGLPVTLRRMRNQVDRHRVPSGRLFIAALAVCSLTACASNASPPAGFRTLYEISHERVFAYSRISPDGQLLVFSYDNRGNRDDVAHRELALRVIDVATGRVLLERAGFDGYWSADSTSLIFKTSIAGVYHSAIWNRLTGTTTLDIIPVEFGDYYSWGGGETESTVLTVKGWFVTLSSSGDTSQPVQMPGCPQIGIGDRPLISRDGTLASVFVGDEVVVRNVRDCNFILKTGVVGGKADWSRDGDFLALHTPKSGSVGYNISVIDLRRKKVYRVTDLRGSSFFPSWTDYGSLVFQYDGPEFKGFVELKHALASVGLRTRIDQLPRAGDPAGLAAWQGAVGGGASTAVLIWSAWGAHSDEALREFADASRVLGHATWQFVVAYDPTSAVEEIGLRLRSVYDGLRIVRAPWRGLLAAGAVNQTPTYFIYEHGVAKNRVLGLMSKDEVISWLKS